MVSYWRRYIPGFANILAPISKLLKKDQKWEWTPECQQAFDQMKDIMTNPPILRPANFSKQFKIYCDASLYSIASILTQTDEDGNEYIIECRSRLLKPAETPYTTSERECLSVVWALGKFRQYIYGTTTIVVTSRYIGELFAAVNI